MPSKTKKFSKNILKNAVVLYLVFAAALINLLVFGYQRDWMSGAIFVLVAFLTTFFSKNMIVILCLAMVVANIYKYGSEVAVSEGTKEGFTEAVDPNAHNDTNMDTHIDNDNQSEPLDSVSYLDQKKEKPEKKEKHEKKEKPEEHESLQKITPELKAKLKKTFNEKVNNSNHSKEKKEQMTNQYEAMLTMAEQFSQMKPQLEKFKAEIDTLPV